MITPLDIENKKFSKQMMNGYSVEEVDDFLDDLTVDYTKNYKEATELKAKVAELTKSLEHYKNIESTLQNTLVMAQKTADDVKNIAKQQADQIVNQAKGTAQKQANELDNEIIVKKKELEDVKKQFDIYKAKMESLLISQLELIKDSFLLTLKPILYIANVSEDQLLDENDANVNSVKEYAKQDKAEVIKLCVKIEEELSSLDGNDKKEMLEALGLEESGLDKVIKASYDLLGLMSFLTAGEPEVRAWTIKKGTKAPQAAGKIHSDIERGFIRAEIVSYDDLMREGSMTAAKEKGLVRSEGKEYIMQDGDIVLFKFNV